MNAMPVILSFTLLFSAGYLMASTMARHRQQIFGRRFALPHARSIALRWSACLCLFLSLYPICSLYGWAIGSVYWFGLLNAALIGAGLMLTYSPHFVRSMGWSCITLSILGTPFIL